MIHYIFRSLSFFTFQMFEIIPEKELSIKKWTVKYNIVISPKYDIIVSYCRKQRGEALWVIMKQEPK